MTTGDAVDLTAYDAWLFDLDGVVHRHRPCPCRRVEGGVRPDPGVRAVAYRRAPGSVRPRRRLPPVRRRSTARSTACASFFASRGLELDKGAPDDPPGARTVCGIADAKNELVRQVLATDGVTVYPGTLALLELLRSQEVLTAVVSASENTGAVLAAGAIGDLFDACVDGLVAR